MNGKKVEINVSLENKYLNEITEEKQNMNVYKLQDYFAFFE